MYALPGCACRFKVMDTLSELFFNQSPPSGSSFIALTSATLESHTLITGAASNPYLMDEDAINKGPEMAKNFPYTAACYHMIPAHSCTTLTINMNTGPTWSYIYNGVR